MYFTLEQAQTYTKIFLTEENVQTWFQNYTKKKKSEPIENVPCQKNWSYTYEYR